MRVLGIGSSCDLGDMYLRLAAEGHDVRVYSEDFAEHGVMDGMLERVADVDSQLDWVREAGAEGLVLFETADRGELQDELRGQGLFVIGGSTYGDRLENDRAFGQRVLAQCGLRTAPSHEFEDFDAGIAFIRAHPQRYVFKLNGSAASAWRNYVGQAPDGSDVIALLAGQKARLAAGGLTASGYVLMQHVEGIETGVGAYFNGERFLEPACLDWEHKRFFPGDLGELTGEMGTVVTYAGTTHLFELTLKRLAPQLRAGGYVGYINLNTIINEAGIWPLELTCRFGYPGFAILDALQPEGWGALFTRMRERTSIHFETTPGFAVGVVLTVPPFPYRYGYDAISRGLPIVFYPELDAAARGGLHFGEVAHKDGHLVTSGVCGYLMVATGTGPCVADAQREAYALAKRVYVPNLRYRNDIGDSFARDGHAALQRLGYMP